MGDIYWLWVVLIYRPFRQYLTGSSFLDGGEGINRPNHSRPSIINISISIDPSYHVISKYSSDFLSIVRKGMKNKFIK
jgi:hypothetical protein